MGQVFGDTQFGTSENWPVPRISTINIMGSSAAGILNAARLQGYGRWAFLNFNHTDSDYHFTTDGAATATAISITVNSGGTLSPGSSIESLASGSNTWNGGGALTFEFSTDGSTGAAGSQWDLLAITGGLDLSGASSSSKFTLNLLTMANATTPGLLATWDPDSNATWAGFVTTTTGLSRSIRVACRCVSESGRSRKSQQKLRRVHRSRLHCLPSGLACDETGNGSRLPLNGVSTRPIAT